MINITVMPSSLQQFIHLYSNGYSVGAVVIVVSTLLLALNISIPNELKGFFFYAQVSVITVAEIELPVDT